MLTKATLYIHSTGLVSYTERFLAGAARISGASPRVSGQSSSMSPPQVPVRLHPAARRAPSAGACAPYARARPRRYYARLR